MPRIYPILDLESCQKSAKSPRYFLRFWYAQGIQFVQLRAKQLPWPAYLELARGLKLDFPELALMANDWEQALKFPDVFCGLHLGQSDLAKISNSKDQNVWQRSAGMLLGLSTHSVAQMKAAHLIQNKHLQFDYLTCGPCFATNSKKDLAPPVLPAERKAMIRHSLESDRKFPAQLVFIGGLNLERIRDLETEIAVEVSRFEKWKYNKPGPGSVGSNQQSLLRAVYAGIGIYMQANSCRQLQILLTRPKS